MTAPQPKPRQKVASYLLEHPDSTITEITAGTKLARSTVTKELKAMEKTSLVTRTRSDKPGAGDRWRPVLGPTSDPAVDGSRQSAPDENEAPPAVQEPPDTAAPATETGTDPAAAGPSTEAVPKLAAGELRALVKVYFAGHPDKVVTAGDVARFLGRSAGAVSNAIQVLIGQGSVRLAGESPRRYTAAPPRQDAAEEPDA